MRASKYRHPFGFTFWRFTLSARGLTLEREVAQNLRMATKRRMDPDRKIRMKLADGDEIVFRERDVVVTPGKKVHLARDFDPGFTGGFKDKKQARKTLERNVEELAELQERLYAQDTWALLLVLQAPDAAGKDGAIKHVMSGVNPQGCQVTSFKKPSANELDQDYLWRIHRAVPARGMIGIFNRSHYEEVLITKVHSEILEGQKLPPAARGGDIWKQRYRQINDFERYLVENGVVVLKFFLNLSFDEQRQRFLDRIDEEDKNWKFSMADVSERRHWMRYQRAYEECFEATSTPWAPWIVIPADHKWFSRLAISETIIRQLRALDLKFPAVTDEHREKLKEIRGHLVDDKPEASTPKPGKPARKERGGKG